MNTPNYLLFARVRQTSELRAWSFTIQPLDGSPPVSAEAIEPEVAGERLELLALVRALEAIDQPGQVLAWCENPHIERQLNQGLDAWRDAGWRWESFGEMVPIPNADLWRRLDRAMHIHQVTCRRVPAALAAMTAHLMTAPAAESFPQEAETPVVAWAPVPAPEVAPARGEPAMETAAEALVERQAEPETPTLSLASAARAPRSPRRHGRPANRRHEPVDARPAWMRAVEGLKAGMHRLRTVAATLA